MDTNDRLEGKRPRVLRWVVVGVLGVFLASVLGLYLYFTPERLRTMLVPVLEGSLHRKVTLKRVGLSLWGGIDASVEGLSVADRPGFGTAPFVSADRAALSLKLWPLLQGETRLGRVEVEDPRISVVINAKGEANYADLTKPKSGKAGRAGGGPGEFRLPVQQMVISGGSLRYEDRQSGSTTTVGGIESRLDAGLSSSGVSLSGDLAVADVRMTSAGSAPIRTGALKLSYRLAVPTGADELEIESLQVAAGPVSLEAKGTVRRLSGIPEVSLSVEKQSVAMDRLAAYLQEAGLMPKGASVQGEATVAARVEGPWNPKAVPPVYPAVSGKVVLKAGRVSDPQLAVPIEGIDAEVDVEGGAVRLAAFRARAGRSDVVATGRVDGLLDGAVRPGKPAARPYVNLTVQGKVLDLDEIVPPVAPNGKTSLLEGGGWGIATPAYGAAPAAPQNATSPTLWLVRTVDGQGQLRFDELKSDGVVYRNFRADARAKDRLLRLDNVRAKVYGGDLRAQVEVDARPPGGPLPVRASVALDSVQANGLVQEYLKWGLPIYGRMGLSMTMSGAVDSTLELVKKTLHAEGAFGMSEGRVVNWGALKQAASSVSQLGFLNFNEIPLRSLVAHFKVADGRVAFQNTQVRAADMACRLSGSFGLDGSLDYALDVDVPASRLNVGGLNVGNALSRFFGGGTQATVPLRIRIRGTAKHPEVKAELQPGGRSQVKEKAQDSQEKLLEKGKGLFNKLF